MEGLYGEVKYHQLKSRMQADGIAFGVIYDGGGAGKSESGDVWTQEAAQRFHHMRPLAGIEPLPEGDLHY
jgi:hypothetical protein